MDAISSMAIIVADFRPPAKSQEKIEIIRENVTCGFEIAGSHLHALLVTILKLEMLHSRIPCSIYDCVLI